MLVPDGKVYACCAYMVFRTGLSDIVILEV